MNTAGCFEAAREETDFTKKIRSPEVAPARMSHRHWAQTDKPEREDEDPREQDCSEASSCDMIQGEPELALEDGTDDADGDRPTDDAWHDWSLRSRNSWPMGLMGGIGIGMGRVRGFMEVPELMVRVACPAKAGRC